MHPLRSVSLLALLVGSASAVAQNQAIQLSTGVDGGVAYAFDARMVPATGITVEAVITYNDSTVPTGLNYWPTIARQNITPNQESWNFRVSAGNNGTRNLNFIVRASNNALYSASYFFAVGEFTTATHVAATYDGQVIRLFKNGSQVALYTTPLLSEVQDNGGVMRIGNGDPVAPGHESWNGTIDEVRIWPMARTAAEIAASAGQELNGMTGGVLVFPMNGNHDSSDGTVVGAPFGTVAFTAGSTLTPVAPLLFPLATPSSTCAQKPGILVGSAPQVGNTAFQFWCVRGPRPVNSPAGAVFAGASPAPPTQPIVLGLDIAFDLTTLLASVVLAPPTDALGNARFALPIPNQPNLVGVSFVFQFAFFDSQCGPQGLTASDGLLFAIQ